MLRTALPPGNGTRRFTVTDDGTVGLGVAAVFRTSLTMTSGARARLLGQGTVAVRGVGAQAQILPRRSVLLRERGHPGARDLPRSKEHKQIFRPTG